MKLSKQEGEDCDAPVWQQLLPPNAVPSTVIENNEVRVNIPTEELASPEDDKPKKRSSSWIPFAPSWSERQRLRNGGGEVFRPHINSASSSTGSTEGDPRKQPKSPVEKSSSSPLMRLVIITPPFAHDTIHIYHCVGFR